MAALLNHLDVDGDGCIAWEEFEMILESLHDENYMLSLDKKLRSALRKVQYSHLPNPRKYLLMYQNLPKCYRRSKLNEISNDEKTIESVLSEKAPAHVETPAYPSNNNRNSNIHKNEVEFEMSVNRVEGVPSEGLERSDDILHRGVRYCIVQTDKVPSETEPGHPPKFLSNVSKMHAVVNDTKRDLWEFDHTDNLNSDLTAFVKANVDESYIFEGDEASVGQFVSTACRQLLINFMSSLSWL
jgi:hypothetical protein